MKIRSIGMRLSIAVSCAALGSIASADPSPEVTPPPAQAIVYDAVDGSQIALADAEPALVSHGLIARIPPAASLDILGRKISSAPGALVYVAISTEFLTFAVIDGAADLGKTDVHPGQAAIVVLRDGKVERLGFDAARLAASAPPAMAGEMRAKLDLIAARQKRRQFWGLLVPTGINAQAPGSPALEAVRATYLMTPTVVALRSAAGGDKALLAQMTTRRFVDALDQKDVATVGDLLDPQPFLAAGKSWQATRTAYARDLVAHDLGSTVHAAAITSDKDGRYTVSGASTYQMTTVTRDSAVFVSGLEAR